MANEPANMEEVASLMRDNLPRGMKPAEFGLRMNWGRGNDEARLRAKTLTADELRDIGLTVEQAIHWAVAYESVLRLMPENPSAAGRAELMRFAARQLSGG